MNFKLYINEKYNITLKYHDTLNPKLWDEEKLKPEVKEKLMVIAERWRDFSNIPKQDVKDIIMTGGNANYNYTSLSDIDVHLVIDYRKISKNDDLVQDYFMDKKTLWTLSHNVKVYGFPVELFAQPITEHPHKNQGVYSLITNEWLTKPVNLKLDFAKDKYFIHKILSLKRKIDDLVDKDTKNVTGLKKLKDKLKSMRSAAIESGGEFSVENNVFKELRNIGSIDKLRNYLRSIEDLDMSL
jgi:hypothetical protein